MGEGVSSQWAEPRARRTAWFLVGEAPPVGWGQRRAERHVVLERLRRQACWRFWEQRGCSQRGGKGGHRLAA